MSPDDRSFPALRRVALLAVILLTSCSSQVSYRASVSGVSPPPAGEARYGQSALANQLDRDLDRPPASSQPNPMAAHNELVRTMESTGR